MKNNMAVLDVVKGVNQDFMKTFNITYTAFDSKTGNITIPDGTIEVNATDKDDAREKAGIILETMHDNQKCLIVNVVEIS